jgi:hypothetical protein
MDTQKSPQRLIPSTTEEENPVKKKNENNGKDLERLDSDLFRSFDPEEESWIVGGSKSITTMYSFGPDGVVDHALDVDWLPLETPPQN